MLPKAFGLTTIQEENQAKTQQWIDDADNNTLKKLRRSFSPRSEQGIPRFFPKQDHFPLTQLSWNDTYLWKQPLNRQDEESFQMKWLESERALEEMKASLLRANDENMILANLLAEKEGDINELKEMVQNLTSKKKVIKLKDRHKNKQGSETARNSNGDSNRLSGVMDDLEDAKMENHMLLRKVKHLEAERKYEDERIRNATLSLQLDLKIKNQQIERLERQLKVYEDKFNLLLSNERKLQDISNTTFGRQASAMENYPEESDGELTCVERKPEPKLTASVTTKKRHGRSGSSNLEEYRGRQNEGRINIKVIRKGTHLCI